MVVPGLSGRSSSCLFVSFVVKASEQESFPSILFLVTILNSSARFVFLKHGPNHATFPLVPIAILLSAYYVAGIILNALYSSSKLIITSILSSRDFCFLCTRVRKQRHRVITELVQYPMTGKRQSWDLNPGACDPEPMFSQFSLYLFKCIYHVSRWQDLCYLSYQAPSTVPYLVMFHKYLLMIMTMDKKQLYSEHDEEEGRNLITIIQFA